MRWLKRILLGLIGLVALAAGVAGIYVWRSVPANTAQHALSPAAGKIGDTAISIDGDGIPAIEAKSERDLSFAVGFMHARDRLWQLEMHRRIGRGELAEILGPKALDTDRFLRTLGVHRAARAQLERLPAETRDLLQAYADGVNSYVREAMTVRPPEFVILGVQPGTWEPADTLAWAIMMAY
ncbi:MAG TPA: penicillin acylase family protein, partial [Casimicrobium huifangae]|nr:penicillin acylase family protein [Casimicrobium huifangae]